jgi:hypothetical protein
MTELELVKLSRAAGRDVKAVSKLVRDHAARGSDLAPIGDPLVETLRDLCWLLTTYVSLTEPLELCPRVIERLAVVSAPASAPFEKLVVNLTDLLRLSLRDEDARAVIRSLLARDLDELHKLLSTGEDAWIACLRS